MKLVPVDPRVPAQLERTEERDKRLLAWLEEEFEHAFVGRQPMVDEWLQCLRMIEAVPKQGVSTTPILNAPNIETPLGAMFSETVYATVIDTLFQASPLLMVRGTDAETAKALQTLVNTIAEQIIGLRAAADVSFLDCCQLGTGVFYVPYVQKLLKGPSLKKRDQAPRIYPIAPEDLLVPAGSVGDVQTVPWVAIRHWYTKGEMPLVAKQNGWDTTGLEPSAQSDPVRSARLRLAKTPETKHQEHHQVWLVWGHFDYDQDGIEEDLLIVYSHHDRRLLKVTYNPFDLWRPLVVFRYQVRPHVFWGKGIVEITRPFEEQLTMLENARTLNVLLANGRLWLTPPGGLDETFSVYPNRVKQVPDPNAIVEKKLADVYPSIWQAESSTLSMAERRLGITGDLTSASPASRILGTRTPGITAISALQAVTRRFTPAFDAMRFAAAEAIKQALLRYRERLLANERWVSEFIGTLLGPDASLLAIQALRSDTFLTDYAIEFTAASASVNREADRQNAMLLVNILGQYYQRVLELTQLASTPGTPPAVVSVAVKVAEKASEIIDRTIRTFDQVRDPATFLVQVEEELAQAGAEANALQALAELLGGAAPGAAPPGMGGAIPPPEVPPELAAIANTPEGAPPEGLTPAPAPDNVPS